MRHQLKQGRPRSCLCVEPLHDVMALSHSLIMAKYDHFSIHLHFGKGYCEIVAEGIHLHA